MNGTPNTQLVRGHVYWITGLAGAGKSTTGRLLVDLLRSKKQNVVFLDGEELRDTYGCDLGYTGSDRQKMALRNARLCRLLSNQGIEVVCATISLFHSCHTWCRQNIPNYHEIYLRMPLAELQRRDTRNLYSGALNRQRADIVGIDICPEEPLLPELVIDFQPEAPLRPEDIVELIWRKILVPQGGIHED